MLTNGFTREELAACTPGATLNCIKSVVMYETSEVTFTAGRTYTVDSATETMMVLKNDHGRSHMVGGYFFRDHFTIVAPTAPRQVVHLSETGLHAGRRFCGAARDDGNRSVHGIYAPLHAPEFRKEVCDACLTIWANEAYDDGDEMPDYVVEARQKHKAASTGAEGAMVSAAQPSLELR